MNQRHWTSATATWDPNLTRRLRCSMITGRGRSVRPGDNALISAGVGSFSRAMIGRRKSQESPSPELSGAVSSKAYSWGEPFWKRVRSAGLRSAKCRVVISSIAHGIYEWICREIKPRASSAYLNSQFLCARKYWLKNDYTFHKICNYKLGSTYDHSFNLRIEIEEEHSSQAEMRLSKY